MKLLLTIMIIFTFCESAAWVVVRLEVGAAACSSFKTGGSHQYTSLAVAPARCFVIKDSK